MNRLLPVLAFAAAAATASAQPAAPAPVPPPKCEKPGEHPGRLASDNQRRTWVRSANGYLECLKKFVGDQQALAAPLLAQAKPHMDAANAAVDEYNKAAAEFKAEQDKNN